MGIWDDLGEVGDSLLTPIKKIKKDPVKGTLDFASQALPFRRSYDLASALVNKDPKALLGLGLKAAGPSYAAPKAAIDILGVDKALALGMGAGFGFMAGGPPGALIGGTAGLASAYAGPPAGKFVAEKTGVPELGTAAEFGVYGVGGGLGLGSGAKVAGKVGAEQLLARLALKSSLELGALSGVSAAAGQAGAKAVGLPEEFGILAGGVGGPVVGPYAFARARTRAFNSESAGMKKLAEYFGANEANAVKRSRAFEPTTITPGDQTPAETVRSLRASAESDRIQAARYTQPGDNEYRQFSGGYTREELRSGKLAGTEGAEIYTPSFRRQLNSLQARNSQLENARIQAAALEAEHADKLAQWPATQQMEIPPMWRERGQTSQSFDTAIGPVSRLSVSDANVDYFIGPNGEALGKWSRVSGSVNHSPVTRADGEVLYIDLDDRNAFNKAAEFLAGNKPPQPRSLSELKEQDGLKYFENPDGTTTAVPDEVWQAKMAVDRASARATTAETRLRERLGLADDAEIPADLAEQRKILRARAMPEASAADSEATQRFLAMSHRERQQLAKQSDILFKAETLKQLGKIDASLKAKARKEALADFIEAHPEKGFIPRELRNRAAQDFEAVRQKELDLVNNPHGYVKPLERPESLEDYMTFVEHRGNAISDRELKARYKKELIIDTPGSEFKPLGTPHYIDPETGIAKAKRIVGFTPDGKVTLRPDRFGTAEQDITVPLGDVVMRYDDAQILERTAEQKAATQLYIRAGMNPEQAKFLESGLSVPEVKVNETFSPERIREDLKFAQDAFEANFSTTQSSIRGVFYTPEQEAQVAYQYASLLNKPWKGRLSKEALAERLEAIQFFRQSNAERTAQYLSVNDPEFLEVFNMDASFDPLKGILHLAGRSVDDYRSIMSDSDVKLWGSTGEYMRKLAIGEVIRNPVVRQINGDIHAAMEASANAVGATYGPLEIGIERYAAEKLGLPMGFKAQGKAALDVLKSTRSIKGAVSELHPLSHKGAWAKLAQSYVDWSKASPDLKASLKRLEEVGGPERVEEFKNLVIQNKRFFMENQEMFVKPVEPLKGRTTKAARAAYEKAVSEATLASDPVVQNYLRATQLYDDTLEKARILWGDAPDTMLRRYMMNVAPEFREYVNLDALRQGSKRAKSVPPNFNEGEHTTLADVATETLKSLKAKGKETMLGGGNRPLSQLMVFGEEADMAVPLATHQSMAAREGVEKLKAFANEPITPDDLVFNGHGWEVRSLNKFPAELRESISGMNQVLSGKHQWAGLQRISQQVALGNLTADMSIMGIQGFKYLAHSLLAGNLGGIKNFAGAAKVKSALGTQTTHIMSDWGFYSWLRQNYDEVSYLSGLGLTGGLKGYIAGPDVNRLPLEGIPVLGKAFTGIREGTDLAFNRLLFYWKVQGVRENLEFTKTMRAISKDFSARFIDSSPTAKAISEDMGGLDNYLYGDKEEVVKAVVRQVNRSYGGVNMAAEGIGPTRQALEQIMTVVPGFFRAQAGQWASIITKPHTLEGQLAISMLGREYLLAAGFVTGMAHLMGTQDKINYEDITKPTWLGLPLPNGDTISILPTMAIPRMASRQIQNAVEAAKGEADFSPDRALEAFAHGRMSPMAGALYDTLHGQDFLGRKYDSNLEKYGMTLSNVTLPIIASSFIEDLKEGVKQNSATGDYNWMDIATNAGVNLLGKSVVPQHPVDRLNSIAQGAFGTDWNLLTDAERNELKKNPAAVAAEAEYDFYSMRRAGSQEQRVDSAYKDYENFIEHNWSDAVMIDNFKSSQNDDDQLLAAGKITGDTWRDRYQARQDASSKRYEYLTSELQRAGLDPDKLREEKMQRLRDGRDPGSMAWLMQAAKTEYNGVEPPTVEQQIATPTGEVTVATVDWDKFHQDREAVLAKYPAAVAQRIRGTEDAKTPGIAIYRQAAQVQQEIEAIPRYRGLTAEQGNQIDRMSLVMSQFAESVKSQMGLPPGTAVPGLASGLRNAAVKQMTKAGIIKTQDDLQLASLAIMMTENPQLKESLRNLEATKAVLANPEVVIYYPYLRHRVPKQLWGQLPSQVFTSKEVQTELNLGG